MNFEERKAEIFRRGNARIAAKKRKKRIILGSVVPILLIVVMAFPVSRLLRSAKGEEKATAIQMENQPSVAPGEHPAPQATYPELILNANTLPCSPIASPDGSMGRYPIGRDPRGNWDLGFFYQTPPDLWLYSLEGDVVKAQEVGYYWTNKILFGGNSAVSESPDILSPGVVDVQINTSYGYLVLDASNYIPWDVDAEYWSASVIGKESYFDGNGENAYLFFDGNQWLPAITDFFPSQKLYRLNLRPGDNIYHISIQWPKGGASYCFRVNYDILNEINDVYLYSPEKKKIQLIPYNGSWTYEQSDQEFTIEFSPAVGKVEIDTSYSYLILDASALMPKQVYGSITNGDETSAVNFQALTAKETAEYIPISLSGNLYRIELKPGENHYSIVIVWPKGLVRYDFTVNYKE